nr:hypothetical protein [Acidobacteriota bacterium]
ALPGALKRAGFPAGGLDEQGIRDAAAQALTGAFGPGDWGVKLVESNLYLDLAVLEARKVPRARAEAVVAEAVASRPGIYAAYTRGQILEGRVAATDIGQRVLRSYHPKVSGDVVLVYEPFWVPGRPGSLLLGTTHGTPYAYDTSVPLLLAGAGIQPGRFTERASTLDIAPTLAHLLGVLEPSGCEGHILSRAVR